MDSSTLFVKCPYCGFKLQNLPSMLLPLDDHADLGIWAIAHCPSCKTMLSCQYLRHVERIQEQNRNG